MPTIPWFGTGGSISKIRLATTLLLPLTVSASCLLRVARGIHFCLVFIVFFTAIVREVVKRDNHGGTWIHSTVWSQGGVSKRKRILLAVREFAWVLGASELWRFGSVGWPAIDVVPNDIRSWRFSFGALVKNCAFLCTLHWPPTVEDLEVGGLSFVELFIMCMSIRSVRGWALIRLCLSAGELGAQFECRLFL